MVLVLGAYFGIIWLIFFKFRLLPWNLFTKGLSVFGGLLIALVVIGALNHTAPSGPVSVQGTAINIAPNVAGPVTEVAVKPNQSVAEGDVLFRIDDTTQAAEVARLEASLASAQAAAERLLTDLAAAQAEIAALEAQLDFGRARRDDIIELADRGASTEFQLQEAVSSIAQLEAGLRAAEARKAGLERRIAAQVEGVDVGVVEVEKALVQARWALEQTVVRAPEDGIVTGVSLRPGNRVSPFQGAINFVIPADRSLVASFPQSSFRNIAVGDTVLVALSSLPGQQFEAVIAAIPPGTSEGTVDARAGLPSLRELAGTSRFVVVMDIPEGLPDNAAGLGASGKALVITDQAGGIAALAKVLFWVTKMMNYI
ncbi:HlyD family secretion protein [Pseudoruegeria sp. SHC-113]|uniref:HlyD family secretion protein n=1 Tax=Pseudoruegeria sp. SHC-113 TaxID=2855439 RepID=UPI0021BB8634|nr:biotin/lipoyl-binding protein [Pseudoruegeria sp. SHC-113]MCT8160693.1 efflux RND transporter periplasmic adaptor subunit [Pseudoruegeria sp. SHC-113]